MSKLLYIIAAAICVQMAALSPASFAQGQAPQGNRQFRMDPDRLVERLNRELTLTADQQKKIKAIYEKAFKSAAQNGGNSGATGAAARRQRMAQQNNAQDDMRKRMEQTNAEIKKVLTPDQQKKFDTMFRGGRGMNADDRIARMDERLKLTPDQKKKLKTIIEKQNQEMQKAFAQMRPQDGDQQNGDEQSMRAMREKMRDTMQKQREKNDKEIEAVLTAAQQKEYRAMQEEMNRRFQQRQGGGNPPPQ